MIQNNHTGRILKGVGGIYSVMLDSNALINCGLRGIFRKDGITPLAGDRVVVSFLEDDTARIDEVGERKNKLDRPPVANIDNLIIVASLVKPKPNYLLIDKMTTIADINAINPIIVINKIDLGDPQEIYDIYKKAGFETFIFNALQPDFKEIERLRLLLKDKITAFSGNSGVGKSSLLNAMFPELRLDTGEISQKLGRGRHTTRTTELFPLGEDHSDGFIIDTPGFSSLDFNSVIQTNEIECGELDSYFVDFSPFRLNCQFRNCSHRSEKGCGVIEARESHKIEKSRYESFVALYEEVSKLKSWE